jgi:hemerythrin
MPNRVNWDTRFSVGNATLDAQHKHFIDLCNALADCLDAGGDARDQEFDRLFAKLMAGAREHFAAEEAILAGCGYPDLEAHRNEQEEFAFLANEIVTTDNFDREELQTFLALWWVGHVMGAVRGYRDYFG